MRMIAHEQSVNVEDIAAVAYAEDDHFYIGAEVGEEHMRCRITKRQAIQFAMNIIEEAADPSVIPGWLGTNQGGGDHGVR